LVIFETVNFAIFIVYIWARKENILLFFSSFWNENCFTLLHFLLLH